MTVTLYAGSFDPPTLGHMDIITRAARVSSQLIVGIGHNPNKRPFLPVDTRVQLLRDEIAAQQLMTNTHARVEVEVFTTATVAFARERGVTALIRGLRGVGDLDRERGLAEVNRVNGFDTLIFSQLVSIVISRRNWYEKLSLPISASISWSRQWWQTYSGSFLLTRMPLLKRT